MIERIDLFMPPKNRYQVLQSLTTSLASALSRAGVKCRILESQQENPQSFVDTILKDNPECTLSFNGLLPTSEGQFFCDLIGIPHVACLVHAPHHFVPLIRSKYSVITCVDRFACDFFEGLDFRNVLFMPHGVDRDLIFTSKSEERPYDVIMLCSYIDCEKIHEDWSQKYPVDVVKALERAVEIMLRDSAASTVDALARGIDAQSKASQEIDPAILNYISIFDELEEYATGLDRRALLKAITGTKVHIFGMGSDHWKKHVPEDSIVAYEPITYEKALVLMRQSKIVLNSSPAIRNGTHDRILGGLAAGAAVITNDNIFMRNNFKDREEILFYRPGHWEDADQAIKEYLADDDKRIRLVERGQEVIRNGHTWDHRAATLISELGPIIEEISYPLSH